jgi:hypothetical protein
MKDGGQESVVWGFWLIEIKSLFSIVILKFENGSRDAYHNHAFHAFSWVVRGLLKEEHLNAGTNWIKPSFKPFITTRECFHKVTSFGNTYALTFRGPWSKTWKEYHPNTDEHITLTHGRKVV